MRPDVKKYLLDVEVAAAHASQFVAGKTFHDYQETVMLRAAVERQCEIIGEALGRLAKVDASVVVRITDYRRIIAFRNILVHGYADVDNRLVWEVVTTKVPTLAAEVSALLAE